MIGRVVRGRARRRLAAAAVVILPVVLVAAGCGGGADGASTGSPPPSLPAPTSSLGSTTSESGSSTPGSEAPGTTEPPGTTTTTELPLPPASPAVSPGDNRVFVLGDSVLAGAKVELPAAMPGWKVTVDASESRFITQGVTVLNSKVAALDKERSDEWDEANEAAIAASQPSPPDPEKATLFDAVGRVVVVNLCTNYEATGAFAQLIPRYMDTLKTMDRVVWMTCSEWSKGQTEANEAIREAVPTYDNAVLADWALYADRTGYTYADGIHLDGPGRKAVAELIALAVGPAPKPA